MKIEFVIENKSSNPRNAVLLGSNYNMFIQNFGSDEGIDVTCLVNDFEKIDYLKLLHQMMVQPNWIEAVMYESFYTKDKELDIHFIHKNANGYEQHLPIKLKRNKRNYVPLLFDANTSIQMNIKGNSKIMFIVDDGKSQSKETKIDKRKLLIK